MNHLKMSEEASVISMKYEEFLKSHLGLGLLYFASGKSMKDFSVTIELMQEGKSEEVLHRVKQLIKPVYTPGDLERLAIGTMLLLEHAMAPIFSVMNMAQKREVMKGISEQFTHIANWRYSDASGPIKDRKLEGESNEISKTDGSADPAPGDVLRDGPR